VGCVTFALTLLGNEAGKTGSGVLATVRFIALAAGISLLELRESDVILVDPDTNHITPGQLRSGSVSVGSAGMEVFLTPQNNSVTVGQSFSVNINIANVPSPGVYGHQFSLYYNGAVLQCVSAVIPSDHFLKPVNPSNVFIVDPGTINQTQCRVSFELSLLGDESGRTGSGVLATVRFTALPVGANMVNSVLELRDVCLVAPNGTRFSADSYGIGRGSVRVVPVSMMQQISIADYSVPFDVKDLTVEVVVENASGIVGGSFDFYFSKMVANSVSLSSGDFGTPVYVIDNDGSMYDIVKVSIAGFAAVGKDAATLANVTFQGINGSTVLGLQNALLTDEKGNTFAPLMKDGSIIVRFPQIAMSPCSVEVGSTINVSIIVLNAENIAGGSVNMTFNSSAIRVVSVLPGDFGVPIVDIRNDGSSVGLAFALASCVGRSNATLAVLRCAGISKGVTFFCVESAVLNDEQGNLVIPEVVYQGNAWGWGFPPSGLIPPDWIPPSIPEFQPIETLLICLLLGSIAVVIRNRLKRNRLTG
jgi:hypothetical protein